MGLNEVKTFPAARSRKQRIVKKLTIELGQDIATALADPNVTDINANPDGKVFVERLDTPEINQITTLSHQARESIIKTVATSLDQVANKENSTIGGELPLLGARFEGVLPPVAKPGPGFSIRKKAIKILTLKDYIDAEVITIEMYAMLDRAIENRENVLIAGGTGTGKTTFINAFVNHISKRFPHDRLVICEDIDEIQSSAPNTFKMIANKNSPLANCIETSLRLSPNRIIIGEIRAASQAEAAFQAWNTGHKGGIFSLHANSALDAVQRLEDLCIESTGGKCQRRITRTVDKILFIKKEKTRRKVTEFYELKNFSDGFYNVVNLVTDQESQF